MATTSAVQDAGLVASDSSAASTITLAMTP
jgi:hypothetical protein